VPAAKGFLLYLRIILFDANEEDHLKLEKLLSDYPEIFDGRLVLGVSYLLRGKPSIARGFLQGMPELSSRAPRYLRVCAMLLGVPNDDLISLPETEYLLPREQFLISRYGLNPLIEELGHNFAGACLRLDSIGAQQDNLPAEIPPAFGQLDQLS
jgi:hypothetical protein